MATIALLGGTGATGKRVLERALRSGHSVRALVRDPAKLELQHERLEVIRGDLLDPRAVEQTLRGSEVVLSLFGQVRGSSKTLQADGTRVVTEVMSRLGIRRIITLSGGGLRVEGRDSPKLADRVIVVLLRLLAGHVLADAEAHLDVLRRSGADWTVVRAPRLTDDPGIGAYRVGWVGVDASTRISRDDLADFILTQVDDRTFVHQLPFVSR